MMAPARRRLRSALPARGRRDALTGLLDRARIRRAVTGGLRRARRGGAVGVVYVDLDNFKLINDTLGHAAGDAVLRLVAGAMREATRGEGILGRLGGDEFALVVAGLGGDASARLESLARRLLAAASRPVEVEDMELRVGASLGIARSEGSEPEAADLVRRADMAMYEAKAAGRNQIVHYDPGRRTDRARARRSVGLLSSLPRAVERGELVLHWQPLVHLEEGWVAGIEALVRWDHPERGLLPPAEFVPFAEETGLVAAIDEWVIGAFTEQRRAWREVGLNPYVGLNLSPAVARRPGALEDILARLAEDGLDLGHVTVELTESAALREDQRLASFVRGLHEAGVTVALDDFGKAYSSLSRLRELPARWIKIDRSFLHDVPADPVATQIFGAVLELVRALGLEHIVEGVDHPEQLELLRDLGVTLGQGFLLGRPVQAGELLDRLLASPPSRMPA